MTDPQDPYAAAGAVAVATSTESAGVFVATTFVALVREHARR